jgi:MFS family permease
METAVRNLSYRELLTQKVDFRNLLVGQFVSEMGNWFNFIAGLGLVRLVSESSPMAAGLLFVFRLIPFAIASPIAGTFVDRFSRRQVMFWTDVIRVAVALMFLLVTSAENLWIAYLATALLSVLGAFFDGAKNAATPNMTGSEGLLAGTALLFSTRFLLMAAGSAFGGIASVVFGYEAAFIINAASFAVSAYFVWIIPEESTRDDETALRMRGDRPSFVTEMREGLSYALTNRFALTILVVNVIWATGGGAINMVFERLGGIHFAGVEQMNPDLAVALLWTAAGAGLFLGMIFAHRADNIIGTYGWRKKFIGWALISHGLLFAVAGFASSLWVVIFFVFVSRMIIGVEFAVQETMFQRTLPDYIRGRISTIDRGAEITIFGSSSFVAGLSMYILSPQTLTVISGVLAALAGVVWFIREGTDDGKRETVDGRQ